MTIHGGDLSLESLSDCNAEAFVGLRDADGKTTPHIPHGYPSWELISASEKPKILGELARAIGRFSESHGEKASARPDRDGFLNSSAGKSFEFDQDGASFGYSWFSRYIKLIRSLRDPRLLSLTRAPGLNAQFDHRYISRNLERATFLPDGTPVFEQCWAPLMRMRHVANDMAGLACWVALDGLRHLFPDSAEREVGAALQAEWDELARRFADDQRLDGKASLFTAEREATLPDLQAALETYVRQNPPVSADARELYLLLDELLNYAPAQSSGEIWGLRDFHPVWEAACLEAAIKEFGEENVLTCDDAYLSGITTATRQRWERYREKVFNRNGIARRPDLVASTNDGLMIVDFKYYSKVHSGSFLNEHRPRTPDLKLCKYGSCAEFCQQVKTNQDVTNIEIYRWLLFEYLFTQKEKSKISLEFWLPHDREESSPCPWMKELNIVFKSSRGILARYASKFRVMD